MMLKQLFLAFVLFVGAVVPVEGSELNSGTDKVRSLEEAILLAFRNNPSLKALKDQSEGLKALIEQASYLPNPELELESENFGGSLDGFNESESTLALSQLIETGGKRSARVGVAKAQHELFLQQRHIESNEVIGNLKIAFFGVQQLQALQVLTSEELKIMEGMVRTVQKRVEHGAVLSAELNKAKLSLQRARIKYERTTLELNSGKLNLAAFWGGSSQDVGLLEEMQVVMGNIPELGELDIMKTPPVEMADWKIMTAKRETDQEKARAVPDLTLSAGYRRLEETDDYAFVGALSVPLPFFDRNQGAIQSSSFNVAAEEKRKKDLKNNISAKVHGLQQELRLQVAQLKMLQGTLLPMAQKTHKAFKQAFNMGRSSYLELLDAQQNYVDTKRELVELKFVALKTLTDLQKLIGTADDLNKDN